MQVLKSVLHWKASSSNRKEFEERRRKKFEERRRKVFEERRMKNVKSNALVEFGATCSAVKVAAAEISLIVLPHTWRLCALLSQHIVLHIHADVRWRVLAHACKLCVL